MKSIKLSDYFEIIYPKYCIVRIIPVKSNKNYQSNKLANAIALSYRSFDERIKKEKKKIFFHSDFKITFMIDIYKEETCFYFVFPVFLKTLMMIKLENVWPSCTFEEVDNVKEFDANSYMYELSYKRECALSLHTDLKTSEPLYSIMAVQNQVEDNDRVSVIYNFSPCSQLGWKQRYQETIEKIKNHESVDRPCKTTEYKIKKVCLAINHFLDSLRDTLNNFIGEEDTKKQRVSIMQQIMGVLESDKDLSPSTKKKERSTIIDTQIAVLSSSKDKGRRESNGISVCQSYSVLGEKEGNELTYIKTKMKKNLNVLDTNIGTSYNTMSAEEVASTCLLVPGRGILEKHKMRAIQTAETQVPEELQKGVMCLGTNLYKGISKKAYLSVDEQFKYLCLCICAPTRSGKTNLLKNLCKDACNNNECTIIFDYCGGCELSNDVSSVIDGNILNIDYDDINKLQGLSYNEIKPRNNSSFEMYRCAKAKAQQFTDFINYLNMDNALEPRMLKYFKAAAIVSFINGGSIYDSFKILQDHKIRKQFILKIPNDQMLNLEDYIYALEELNEWSRGTKDNPPEIIGTHTTYITGIINRVEQIKSNAYMEYMLKKDDKNNFDLSKEIEERDLICIKMPEFLFQSDEERDAMSVYWLSKVLGALQVRYNSIPQDKRRKVNLVFDEVYQCKCLQRLISKRINRIAKHNAKPIITCHSLAQISLLKNELKNSNTSYMLISGCEKSNYQELREELENNFDLEDMLNMKRFYSMNLIKTSDGYSSFITKLPGKIGK